MMHQIQSMCNVPGNKASVILNYLGLDSESAPLSPPLLLLSLRRIQAVSLRGLNAICYRREAYKHFLHSP